MKVLLINPKMASGWTANSIPPIGLNILKSCLVRAGFCDVRVIDIGGSSIDRVAGIIKSEYPDIIGVTSFTENRMNALKTVSITKQVNPDIVTIMGGVHPTFMHEQIMQNYPFVDIICRGESEITIVELLRAIKDNKCLSNVSGIVYRNENDIVVTEEREKIENLDAIPFPDYDDLDLRQYKEVTGMYKGKLPFPIITSRGCPYSCTYCSSRSAWGKWRYRSLDNVFDEISFLMSKYNCKIFNILDDIFTISAGRILDFCRIISQSNLDIEWRIQTRVDCVSFDMLKMMKAAGCSFITFGVESGSLSILENLNKKEKIEDVINAFDWCKKIGIGTCCNIIIGAPGENEDTINETRELIRQINPPNIAIAALRIYPGTMLSWQAKEEGLYDDDFFLTDQETLWYTGAMTPNKMYREARRYLLLHASINGLSGYLKLLRFGWETFRVAPKKIAMGLLPFIGERQL